VRSKNVAFSPPTPHLAEVFLIEFPGGQMMSTTTIDPEYLDLFEKRAYASLATLMPDGSPQVTPVWIDFDGTYLWVNTARGRQKDLNMTNDPRVAIEIRDPEDPDRYLQVRGKVVEITEEGADAHIDKMAKKYTGKDSFPNRKPGQTRVIYKILPYQD
jgi:PPOX class probable F420-dependent enzyme